MNIELNTPEWAELVLSFRCPVCKAEPGQQCKPGRRWAHLGRQDRAAAEANAKRNT